MRLIVVSDTHGNHEKLGVLEGDVLVHCGDFCDGFCRDPGDIDKVDAWFAEQRFDLILCVGGNHDFEAEERFMAGERVLRNAVWLLDDAYVYRGVKFYGAPWLPELQGWAFCRSERELRKKWAMIPNDTNVLITHTPPYGILDQPRSRPANRGCPHLLERVRQIRPSFHLFGHIHESAGIHSGDGTTFVNASVVGSSVKGVRSATAIDLP